jgi:hypothetical protein
MPVALSALWPPAFVPHTSRVVKARASKGFQKDGASEPSKGIKGSSKDANQQLKVSCLVKHCIFSKLESIL